jgi:hypothetical protein
MFKYILIIFIVLSLLILPVSGETVCPTCTVCPQQTPHLVYVTVTVPIPVQVTQAQTTKPVTNPTTTPTDAQESELLDTLIDNYEILIYGGLITLVIVGVILMKKKQKKKPPVQSSINIDELNLFEEDPPFINVPTQPEPPKKLPDPPQEKSKKPKKPKSLLDQDFEF